MNNCVVFEVDGWIEEVGWLVVLCGKVEIIIDDVEFVLCDKMLLFFWVFIVKCNYVCVEVD